MDSPIAQTPSAGAASIATPRHHAAHPHTASSPPPPLAAFPPVVVTGPSTADHDAAASSASHSEASALNANTDDAVPVVVPSTSFSRRERDGSAERPTGVASPQSKVPASVTPAPPPASPTNAPPASGNKWYLQLSTQLMLRTFAAARSLKRVSPVWSLLASLLAAYLTQGVLPSPSLALVNVVVALLFLCVGLALPLRDLSHAATGGAGLGGAVVASSPQRKTAASGNISSTTNGSGAVIAFLFVCLSQLVVAPALTFLFFWLLFSDGGSRLRGPSGMGDSQIVSAARLLAVSVAAALPPSPSASAALAATVTGAGGSSTEAAVFLLTSLLSTGGLLVVPLAAQLAMRLQHQPHHAELAVSFRDAPELLTFVALITVLPLACGGMAQLALHHFCKRPSSSAAASAAAQDSFDDAAASVVVAPTSSSSAPAAAATALADSHKPPSLFGSIAALSPLPFEEDVVPPPSSSASPSSAAAQMQSGGATTLICDQAQQGGAGASAAAADPLGVRGRARKCVGALSFALRFCCFVLLFHNSRADAAVAQITAAGELLRTAGVGALIAVVHCAAAWLVSGVATQLVAASSPPYHHHHPLHLSSGEQRERVVNTRLAIFLSSIQKSDMLVMPLFAQLLSSTAGFARVIALMVHATAFAAAFLLVGTLLSMTALRDWRRRQLCADAGALLLPQHYSHVPSHHRLLAPPSPSAAPPSTAALLLTGVKQAAKIIRKTSKSEASKV